MKLVPRCDFTEYSSNLVATPSTGTPFSTITAGATPHVKTAFTSLINPVPGDAYGFWLAFHNTFLAATNSRALMDIAFSDTGVGAVAGDIVLADYLVGARANLTNNVGIANMMWVPIFVPSGKRLSARFQSARASAVLHIGIFPSYCSPSNVPWKVWNKADALGTTAASSSGTAHTAGNSGAESSWASVGSTTSRAYEAFLCALQYDSTTTKTALAFHFEFGADSTAMLEYYVQGQANESIAGPFPPSPIYRGAPSGTQMQVRGECSGTAEVLDVALYGLY